MKLFEAAWKDGFKCFERVYDDELGHSITRQINSDFEWFEPSSNGQYTYILDPEIKLKKRLGSWKNGNDKYGFSEPIYRHIRDNYWGSPYLKTPKIWYLDIETRSGVMSRGFPDPFNPVEEISLIQINDKLLNAVILFGVREWENPDEYVKKFPNKKIRYVACGSERKMLENFLDFYKKRDPNIILAWNGTGFDFPFIHGRLVALGMDPTRLSNYGPVSLKIGEIKDRRFAELEASGHAWLDMQKVYEKFTFQPMPSYSLDAVSQFETGRGKVDHGEFGSFDEFYQKAHDKFVYYAIDDVVLLEEIDDKRNFSQLMVMIAEKMGVLLHDTVRTVKPWAQYISNVALTKNRQVMPPKQHHGEPDIVGGFVKDPVTGKHRWVVSVDVNSMYPLLSMCGFNMSPETYVPKDKLPPELRDIVLTYFNDQVETSRFNTDSDVWSVVPELLKKHGLSLGINGAAFRTDVRGIIPTLVSEIYGSRKAAKETEKNYEKQAVLIEKILAERVKR